MVLVEHVAVNFVQFCGEGANRPLNLDGDRDRSAAPAL
jgi:hypothetical protein